MIVDEMDEVAVKGLHRIGVRDNTAIPMKPSSRSDIARCARPAADRKQKRYPALTLTVIHAEERVTPWATSNRNGGRDHIGRMGDIERNPERQPLVGVLVLFT